ncbi:MAG: valine--tRNA ligase [Elusimicrobiota bacterium]
MDNLVYLFNFDFFDSNVYYDYNALFNENYSEMSIKKLPKNYPRKKIEEKWQKYWREKEVFAFNYNADKPTYSVDTPPPYVSADHLHVGHIMSYAQAEFIVRYKRMKGFDVFYPMGFDDNGLPTEYFVENKYGINKEKTTRSEFSKICLKETEKGIKSYKKLWNNLGISVDWDKTYSTINPLATEVSQWSLIDLYKKDALYRKEAPVLWCPACQTAVAQADLESQERKSKINYIIFETVDGKELEVATTRPELLPACVALYINPNDKRYKNLVGKEVHVPLFDYKVPIHTSKKVDVEFGTGIMMVCTWGDKEDLEKWKADDLNTRILFSKKGKLTKIGKEYAGQKINEARTAIISDLKARGLLTKQEGITHTINTHERCNTPTEFISSKQWFIKISGKKLKNKWLEYGKKIDWHPEEKFNDYKIWVDSIDWDWCISRQRYYGVPFPIWYCEKCSNPIFAQEQDLPIDPSVDEPPVSKCPKCNHNNFIPEEDVMDTWAVSSCTPFIIPELLDNEKTKKEIFPASLRPNGFDIIRTWVFYSIVKSYYHFKEIPFENLMISGHGVDETGRKISKRLENYVPSQKLIEKYGADAIRYWATGAKLGQNLRFDPEEIKKGEKTTIKLWNVARFILMNLEENNKNNLKIDEFKNLEDADIWIINKTNQTINNVTEAFENYNYAEVREEISSFFWSNLANYYMEFIKYRLNGGDRKSKEKAQSTLLKVFLKTLKMYAPILPFVTEEIYSRVYGEKKSIHLSNWPEQIELDFKTDISGFENAIKAIDEIKKYKSKNSIPLGNTIDKYSLNTKVNLEKYGKFIKEVININKLE